MYHEKNAQKYRNCHLFHCIQKISVLHFRVDVKEKFYIRLISHRITINPLTLCMNQQLIVNIQMRATVFTVRNKKTKKIWGNKKLFIGIIGTSSVYLH